MTFKLLPSRIFISAIVVITCFAACKKKKKDIEPEKPPVVVIPEDGPDLPADIKPEDLLMTGFIGGQATYPVFYETTEFIYHPDNRLKEIRRIGPYSTPQNNPMFSFEYTGSQITAINANAVNGPSTFQRVDFTYADGQIRRATYKYSNDPTRIDSLFYNANGNLVMQKLYKQRNANPDELVLDNTIACELSGGNITKETFTTFSPADGRIIDTSSFHYIYTDRMNLLDQTVNDHIIWRILNYGATEQLSRHLPSQWLSYNDYGQPKEVLNIRYSFDAQKLSLTQASHTATGLVRTTVFLFKRK